MLFAYVLGVAGRGQQCAPGVAGEGQRAQLTVLGVAHLVVLAGAGHGVGDLHAVVGVLRRGGLAVAAGVDGGVGGVAVTRHAVTRFLLGCPR